MQCRSHSWGWGARPGRACPAGADRRGGHAGLRREGVSPGPPPGRWLGRRAVSEGTIYNYFEGKDAAPDGDPRRVERDGAAGGGSFEEGMAADFRGFLEGGTCGGASP